MRASDDQDRAAFDRAVQSSTPHEALAFEVIRRFDDESTRPMLVSALQQFALDLRQDGREAEEDVVLDVLDCLTGFCSPGARIDPPTR